MDEHHWRAWIDKSKKIQEKYEHNKKLIVVALESHKSRMFQEYQDKEVLILLFFLKKIIDVQESLANRLINGTKLFLGNIHNRNSPYQLAFLEEWTREIHNDGLKIRDVFEKEQSTLSHLSEEFSHIEGKVSLKDIEEGVFYTKITEHQLKKITEKIIEHLPQSKTKVIKSVHKNISLEIRYEKSIKKELILRTRNFIHKTRFNLQEFIVNNRSQVIAQEAFICVTIVFAVSQVLTPELIDEISLLNQYLSPILKKYGFNI